MGTSTPGCSRPSRGKGWYVHTTQHTLTHTAHPPQTTPNNQHDVNVMHTAAGVGQVQFGFLELSGKPPPLISDLRLVEMQVQNPQNRRMRRVDGTGAVLNHKGPLSRDAHAHGNLSLGRGPSPKTPSNSCPARAQAAEEDKGKAESRAEQQTHGTTCTSFPR